MLQARWPARKDFRTPRSGEDMIFDPKRAMTRNPGHIEFDMGGSPIRKRMGFQGLSSP